MDSEWSLGPGLFFDTSTDLPFAAQTQLKPDRGTYYFRTTFEYSGERIPAEILLQPIVDDGAVIYLNGAELLRINMPEGPISFDTPALAEASDPDLSPSLSLPVNALRAGQNVIAVEVHQSSKIFGIDVGNSSFEVDRVAPIFAPVDWDGAGFSFAGLTRVTQMDSSNSQSTNPPYPDGSQAIVLRSDDGEAMEIFQDVGTVFPGTYTLSFSVADRFVSQWLNYRVELLAVDNDGETAFFAADSAAQTDLRPVNGSTSHRYSSNLAGREGDWLNVTLTADAAAQHAGKTLRLKFITSDPSSGDTGQHYEFAIDNIQMSVDRDLVSDATFGARLDLKEIVPPTPKLRINEIAGVDDPNFFVELVNRGNSPIDLAGMELRIGADATALLPPQQIGPGELIVISRPEFAVAPTNGDRLFLMASSDIVLDARAINSAAQGLRPNSDDWLFVAMSTPGSANLITLHDEIVINEIMYHPVPQLGQAALPAQKELTSLLPFNSNWRYNESGIDLREGWQSQSHAAAGDWKQGSGAIGFLNANQISPASIGTELTAPAQSRIRTYYFETDLVFDADELSSFETMELRHLVDDGAIIYINGVEVLRHRMPAGQITSATFASTGIGDPQISEPIPISTDLFRVGSNRLSVEVHQVSASSLDVLFGLELVGTRVLTPPTPGVPYQESPLEWIELFNKSDASVDVSGWQLDDAIRYSFPPGTTVAAGEYLVVAKDLTAMRTEYPELRNVVGDYSGMLSNREGRILLFDVVGNPADEVTYFDGGVWDDRADGNGPSLELVDPRSDNSQSLAWLASDESSKSDWQTYTYRGLAGPTIPGEPRVVANSLSVSWTALERH